MVIRYKNKPSQRQLRVAEQIRQGLSEVFMRGEINAPLFEKYMVIITEVRISPDLSNATAFVSLPKELSDQKEEIIKFLNEINKTIKPLLSKKIYLKYSPNIRFVNDKAIDEGEKIDQLFKNHHLD